MSEDFELVSEEEARELFAKKEYLTEDITAYRATCDRCKRDVIAINGDPIMFGVNVCYADGTIFGTVKICPPCVVKVLSSSQDATEDN